MSPIPQNPIISESRIWDWYDGLIAGLIKFQNTEVWFYASLLAWDMPAKQQIFALLPLDKDELRRLNKLIGEEGQVIESSDWRRIEREIKKIIGKGSGPLAICLGSNIDTAVLNQIEIDFREMSIADCFGRGIEAAISDQAIADCFTFFNLKKAQINRDHDG